MNLEPLSQYFLFGSPIQHSLSPLLHNTGFQFHALPLTYSLCDTTDINVVKQTLELPSTAGGSVTIPHKQAVMDFIPNLSQSARQIGAVNTVFKVRKIHIYIVRKNQLAKQNSS